MASNWCQTEAKESFPNFLKLKFQQAVLCTDQLCTDQLLLVTSYTALHIKQYLKLYKKFHLHFWEECNWSNYVKERRRSNCPCISKRLKFRFGLNDCNSFWLDNCKNALNCLSVHIFAIFWPTFYTRLFSLISYNGLIDCPGHWNLPG